MLTGMGYYRRSCALALLAVTLVLAGCDDGNDSGLSNPAASLRINELQYLGTHNSYHIQIRDDLFQLLLAFVPGIAPTLAYTHVPLTEQFETQGIRQIELDIFHDPEGGYYANRNALTFVMEPVASGLPELDAPGLKVLHVQEIDYETTCLTFVLCLREIRAWSDRNPDHLPITVLVEAKDDDLPDVDSASLGFVIPLPFDRQAMDRIDFEIRSVFPDERLILPDDVRGDAATLEMAVLAGGWPMLSEARGKIMFALDNGGAKRDLYIEGHSSLAGRVMFTDSPAGTPEAAFMKKNDPRPDPEAIAELVRQGYMVRTRADADTEEARSGDITRRETALATGAHFISTDYPVPNPEFGDYQVTIPGGGVARCNPVNPGNCTDDLVGLFELP